MRRRSLYILLLVIIIGAAAYRYMRHHPSPGTGPKYLVSIGDSVAAGVGLAPVGDPSAADSACGRSKEAYPVVLAQELKLQLKQFACSSAKTTDGVLQSQIISGQTLPAQLDAAARYVKGNDVVVTIGANDVAWTDMLMSCARTECSNQASLEAYYANLAALGPNLEKVFTRLKALGPRKLIVNQYYGIIKPTDTCLRAYGITPTKEAWVQTREDELNASIAAYAKNAGAVVVHEDFRGHQLCDSTLWLQGILDPAPLHPNREGQQALATRNAAALER